MLKDWQVLADAPPEIQSDKPLLVPRPGTVTLSQFRAFQQRGGMSKAHRRSQKDTS